MVDQRNVQMWWTMERLMVVREDKGLVIWWGKGEKERLRERCLMDQRDEAMVVRVFQGWERLLFE